MPDQKPHTPTTEEVRLAHAESVTFHQMEEPELTEANSMFDRWLAARDAAIEAAAEQRGAARGKVEGLREAADEAGSWGPACINAALAIRRSADLLEVTNERN